MAGVFGGGESGSVEEDTLYDLERWTDRPVIDESHKGTKSDVQRTEEGRGAEFAFVCFGTTTGLCFLPFRYPWHL